MPPRRSQVLPVSLLVGVTVVWGSTFVVVKSAVSHMPVMDFLAWRFAIATAVMIAVRPRSILVLSRRGWLQGGLLGLVLAGGYVSQTFGLQHTSAAISGFITGMFVVFTPLLSGALLRRRVPVSAWAATALAAGGLAVMTLHGLAFGLGESLTLVCALCYALQLVGLGEWAGNHDPYALCVVQLLVATVCCVAASAPSTLAPPPSVATWAAVVGTGVLATAVAFLIQTWAQVHVSPMRAAIVLTMEPVFAGITAALAGEALGWRVLAGGAIVLAAMYVVELSPSTVASADLGVTADGGAPL